MTDPLLKSSLSQFDELTLNCKDAEQLALEAKFNEVAELKGASTFTSEATVGGKCDVHSVSGGDTASAGTASAVPGNIGVDLGTELKESSFHQDLLQKTLPEYSLQIDTAFASDILTGTDVTLEEDPFIQTDASVSRELTDQDSLQEDQSADIRNTRSVEQDRDPKQGTEKKRKLKTLWSFGPKTSASEESDSVPSASKGRACKRRQPSVEECTTGAYQFKSSKRTKRYLEKPFDDPELEKSRLNAINAKLNRDRKKHEVQLLNQKCEDLSSENQELSETKQTLEARLKAAEEEVAFLRKALLNGSKPRADRGVPHYDHHQTATSTGASVLSRK